MIERNREKNSMACKYRYLSTYLPTSQPHCLPSLSFASINRATNECMFVRIPRWVLRCRGRQRHDGFHPVRRRLDLQCRQILHGSLKVTTDITDWNPSIYLPTYSLYMLMSFVLYRPLLPLYMLMSLVVSLSLYRVLKSKGVFLIISYGIPDNRLQYLQDENYSWAVTVHTVRK